MGMLSGFLKKRKNINNDSKSNFIFYRIVDTGRTEFEYTLQCIKTNAFFIATISDIISDSTFLLALHPTQACYLGIEYAKYINKNPTSGTNKNAKAREIVCRYGTYIISYQDRNGMVCFCDQETNQQFFMDPRDIALSEDLIEYFDASQAFYIGLFAGKKLQKSISDKNKIFPPPPRQKLMVIK